MSLIEELKTTFKLNKEIMNKKIELELAVFNPIESGLAELALTASKLLVKGVDDKEGCKEVKAFRTGTLVKLRGAVESKRKEIKSFYLEAGRAIDARSNEIQGKIEIIESQCKAQENIVDDEVARIKAEEDAKKKAILDERIAKLQAVKAGFSVNDLLLMPEVQFLELLNNETNRFDQEESDRISKEKELTELRAKQADADRKLEVERNKAEKANQELIKIQQAELRKKDDENKKLAMERAEIDNKNQAEANERARVARDLEANKQAEIKAQQLALEKARKEVADKKLFDSVRTQFATIETAWVEIVRLTKLQGAK